MTTVAAGTSLTALRQKKLPNQVYHLVEASNWASVQRHGLLSARELLRLAGVSEEDGERVTGTQRLGHTVLSAEIAIRDQTPMPPEALQRCLVGMAPAEWYALLNDKVFFWGSRERMERHLGACGSRPQILLTLDTQRLIERHGERVALTPFNTGNARRKAAIRGRATFVLLDVWRETGWRSEAEALGISERPASHAPVELTVQGAVRDVMEFVTAIESVHGREAS